MRGVVGTANAQLAGGSITVTVGAGESGILTSQ
jgi:hypothetical protein